MREEGKKEHIKLKSDFSVESDKITVELLTLFSKVDLKIFRNNMEE